MLVTTEALYRRKVEALRPSLPELEHVLLVGEGGAETAVEGTHDLARLLRAASDEFTIEPTDPEDPALVHFTSGTTGRPKAAVHVHGAVVAHRVTAKLALDLHPDDVFWCTADPGWVTGTSYGIIGPLANGVTSIVDEGEFDGRRWYETLRDERVNVWYTAPTAIRRLMRAGVELAQSYPLPGPALLRERRRAAEPRVRRVGAGSARPAVPRQLVADRDRRDHDRELRLHGHPPGLDGAAAARRRRRDRAAHGHGRRGDRRARTPRASSPCGPAGRRCSAATSDDPERTAKCFAGGWYLTGDLARRDADGYFWFIGRGDDVIKSQGHLIGPFEVESALHGAPGRGRGRRDRQARPDRRRERQGVRRAASPAPTPGHELERELLGFARVRLGAVVAPKEIEFVDHVPKTRSGKIMRRLLKARELGLEEGDTSTLEDGA